MNILHIRIGPHTVEVSDAAVNLAAHEQGDTTIVRNISTRPDYRFSLVRHAHPLGPQCGNMMMFIQDRNTSGDSIGMRPIISILKRYIVAMRHGQRQILANVGPFVALIH